MNQALKLQDEALTGLELETRIIRAAEARRLDHLVAGYNAVRGGELARRGFLAEAALATGYSSGKIGFMLGLGMQLAELYVETGELVRSGALTLAHAEVIERAGRAITSFSANDADAGRIEQFKELDELAESRRQHYEREVVQAAREVPANQLERTARRLAEKWAIDPIAVRQKRATSERRISVVEFEDGMAELRAFMPVIQARGLHDRLTRIAKAAQRGFVPAPPNSEDSASHAATGDAPASSIAQASETDERRLDALRVDVLIDLLSRDPFDAAAAPEVQLQGRIQLVVTPAGFERLREAAAGTVILDSAVPAGGVECALEGYGPVDLDSVRPLVGAAHRWDLVTVCEHTGTVIRTDSYKPSFAQRRFLAARDQHCRWPGCRQPVFRSDVDHTRDAALGGPTATDNLAHLCRMHHTLKGETAWTVRQDPKGVLEWTSPTGRKHATRPPDLLPEHRTGSEPASTRKHLSSPAAARSAAPSRKSRVRFSAEANRACNDASTNTSNVHPF
ncbi:HNH endonuclease signature motif containing protein [Leucobacter sp. BZR 635]